MRSMSSGLQQRLVGALVLIALGVIFWPIVFHDTAIVSVDKTSQIPPAPQYKPFTVEAPKRLNSVSPVDEKIMGEAIEHDSQEEESKQVDAVGAVVDKKPVEDKPAESKVVLKLKQPGTVTPLPSTQQAGLDSDGLPVSWVVQVASLSDAAKAKALSNKLMDKGFKSYVKATQVNGKKIYRILVGPQISLSNAESAKRKIDEQFKVNALIKRYSLQSRP